MSNESAGTVLSFDLTPVVIPISLGSVQYELREATEAAACQYRNTVMRGSVFVDGKISRMEGMADAEPLLVSLCLSDAEGKPVPLAVVQGWPSRVVKHLFDAAKKISELDEGDVARGETVKNV